MYILFSSSNNNMILFLVIMTSNHNILGHLFAALQTSTASKQNQKLPFKSQSQFLLEKSQ